jgi:3'(2'), 5'-bisphosphate nucleotidase
MSNHDNPSQLLGPVIDCAAEAGRKIMQVYTTDFAVTHKDDLTPLTHADLAAHQTICEGLRRLTPDLPMLSEESAHIPFGERAAWRRYWLIDPLDGTREFIKRNGEFTVNIALIDEQHPVLGVVYAPVTGLCYFASRGHGAYKQVPDALPQAIHTRRYMGGRCDVQGSTNVAGDRMPGATVVAASRSHSGDSLRGFLARLGDHEILSIGSSLKSCLVAEGRADVYPRLGPTSEWDTAAAQCVVEEAGGRVTDTAMQTLRYNTKPELLNPYFFVSGDPECDWSQYLKDADTS